MKTRNKTIKKTIKKTKISDDPNGLLELMKQFRAVYKQYIEKQYAAFESQLKDTNDARLKSAFIEDALKAVEIGSQIKELDEKFQQFLFESYDVNIDQLSKKQNQLLLSANKAASDKEKEFNHFIDMQYQSYILIATGRLESAKRELLQYQKKYYDIIKQALDKLEEIEVSIQNDADTNIQAYQKRLKELNYINSIAGELLDKYVNGWVFTQENLNKEIKASPDISGDLILKDFTQSMENDFNRELNREKPIEQLVTSIQAFIVNCPSLIKKYAMNNELSDIVKKLLKIAENIEEKIQNMLPLRTIIIDSVSRITDYSEIIENAASQTRQTLLDEFNEEQDKFSVIQSRSRLMAERTQKAIRVTKDTVGQRLIEQECNAVSRKLIFKINAEYDSNIESINTVFKNTRDHYNNIVGVNEANHEDQIAGAFDIQKIDKYLNRFNDEERLGSKEYYQEMLKYIDANEDILLKPGINSSDLETCSLSCDVLMSQLENDSKKSIIEDNMIHRGYDGLIESIQEKNNYLSVEELYLADKDAQYYSGSINQVFNVKGKYQVQYNEHVNDTIEMLQILQKDIAQQKMVPMLVEKLKTLSNKKALINKRIECIDNKVRLEVNKNHLLMGTHMEYVKDAYFEKLKAQLFSLEKFKKLERRPVETKSSEKKPHLVEYLNKIRQTTNLQELIKLLNCQTVGDYTPGKILTDPTLNSFSHRFGYHSTTQQLIHGVQKDLNNIIATEQKHHAIYNKMHHDLYVDAGLIKQNSASKYGYFKKWVYKNFRKGEIRTQLIIELANIHKDSSVSVSDEYKNIRMQTAVNLAWKALNNKKKIIAKADVDPEQTFAVFYQELRCNVAACKTDRKDTVNKLWKELDALAQHKDQSNAVKIKEMSVIVENYTNNIRKSTKEKIMRFFGGGCRLADILDQCKSKRLEPYTKQDLQNIQLLSI